MLAIYQQILNSPKRYTVTAALPYANGSVHIGHLAGCYLPADIYVRYLRSKGEDVKFICGSDEHGVPITIKAKQEGISPQQVVDKYHKIMGDAFREFGISFDIYSRTSNKTHHETASGFFKNLYDKKVFTEEITEQYFDEKSNQFLADRYIIGTCPKCGNENAYGDQCEKCGSSLSPTELINPRSTLSGEKPVLKKTKNWFLPLDKMQPQIEKYINSHSNDWRNTVYGQCKSWLDQKLQPRAMTRDLDWGVKVPLPNAEGKVLYVWFDAPIGYVSATKELLPNDWEKYWKDKETKLVHFIGKDNIVFHCIIFPAMLMAHGDYILPESVPANEFLNLEGDKISTSRNWAVWLDEYLKEFPNRQDELRYVLTSIAPETKDSEFTWKDFQARVNNELADILGNYIKRVVDLVHRYCDGKVPMNHTAVFVNPKEKRLEDALKLAGSKTWIKNLIENFKFREAQAEIINLARSGNQYLQETEPWKLIKTDKEKVENILYSSIQNCVDLTRLMAPFLPFTSRRLCEMLNLPEDVSAWGEEFENGLLKTGHQLNQSEILFKKIEDEEIEKQIQKLHSSKNITKENNKTTNQIMIEDFKKIDIRVGSIVSAEDFPEAKKPAYKLKIDFGKEIGIKNSSAQLTKNYTKEQLQGKLILGIVNLPPRKVGSFVSEVLTLGVPDKNNECILVEPERGVEIGGRLY